MLTTNSQFNVLITVTAAGPVRPRTKYRKNVQLRAEASITLPFVPYPGLYLNFSKTMKRGASVTLYLRVRTVEWEMSEQRFQCVADEMLHSELFSETYEVRGGARIAKHFQELEEQLRSFGFDVSTDVDDSTALNKRVDGVRYDV